MSDLLRARRQALGHGSLLMLMNLMPSLKNACLLAVMVAAAACRGDDEDETPAVPSDPALFSDLFEAQPYRVSACDTPDGQLKHQREVRLFRGGTIDVAPYSRSLQRYFNRHELQFFTRYAPTSTSLSYALDTDLASLENAARKALPGVNLDQANLTPAQEETLTVAITNQLLSPIIRFANQHGTAGTALTNIVILPQLQRPGGDDLLGGEGEIAGLAVSPALLAEFQRSNSEEGRIWQGVAFPADFTPMMFLHKGVLDQAAGRDEVARDLVVAHEFGHTGALVHTEEPANLMLPSISFGGFSCADGLNPMQMATLRQTLGVPGPVVAQSLQAPSRPEPAKLVPGQRLREIRRLLRGERGPIPSFLRPLLHVHGRR